MMPNSLPSSGAALLEVRPAVLADRDRITNLLLLGSHVHKHLDWKAPMEWLGHSPFMVLEEGNVISGALACQPDPESIAWLRLFAFASHRSGPDVWQRLWPLALQSLEARGGGIAAAIVSQPWLGPILLENGFRVGNHIVLMEMDTRAARIPRVQTDHLIRAMLPGDLPTVVDIDTAAFEPLWRNSLDALTHALSQASYASVAEEDSGLVGYQLSTGGPFGTHLARLAVLPAAQRRGLGGALVQDLIAHIPAEREPRLTVNTQADNPASHALYARLGFRRTGELFPVYAVEIPHSHSPGLASGGLH